MLEVNLHQPIDLNLSTQKVVDYANLQGWKPVPQQNSRLMVFQKGNDDYGNPIHLVLPSHERFEDLPQRIAEAVELFAAVEQRPIEEVVADIQNA